MVHMFLLFFHSSSASTYVFISISDWPAMCRGRGHQSDAAAESRTDETGHLSHLRRCWHGVMLKNGVNALGPAGDSRRRPGQGSQRRPGSDRGSRGDRWVPFDTNECQKRWWSGVGCVPGSCRRVTLGQRCFNASYVSDKVSSIWWKQHDREADFYRRGGALKHLLGGNSLVIATPLHAGWILMEMQGWGAVSPRESNTKAFFFRDILTTMQCSCVLSVSLFLFFQILFLFWSLKCELNPL